MTASAHPARHHTDFLKKVMAQKATEVEQLCRDNADKRFAALMERQPPPRPFHDALLPSRRHIVAEIKPASPSAGIINSTVAPAAQAAIYAEAGASCLSVLTDATHFHGSLDHLVAARTACALPVLRKDFICHPIQVDEARAFGADAVLLIVKAVPEPVAHAVMTRAGELGMDILVEVNTAADVTIAKQLGARLILINNRNLETLEVDSQASVKLAPLFDDPDQIVIAASGYVDRDGLDATTAQSGINRFLIGEMLMRTTTPAEALRHLLDENPAVPAKPTMTHLNPAGEAHMVDVGHKVAGHRRAIAAAKVTMSAEALTLLRENGLKKGDALASARIAGIMAAKKTSERIPLCHPIPISKISVDFAFLDACSLSVKVECHTFGQTGIEIEALDAASAAALTVYDMIKSVDRGAVISDLRLLEKAGGKSGHWQGS
ncbi:MAG: cyclic pyranopterin monophosphate synthase MoaC [Alphaproteobacteria bacterium]|nr:cyclic pyranopterin monophosphate synthase MoaC [Alphaproteobacteria bacterium]